MRFFLDANVLFSAAHNPQGNARALFRLAETGAIVLVTSSYAREETVRNVKLKFPRCAAQPGELLERIALGPESVASLVNVAFESGLPGKDAPILAAAITAGADILVTGDRRHFGQLYGRSIGGALILPPADALARVLDFLEVPPSGG